VSHEPPLCVDLDGTLVRTDTLIESLLRLVKANPLVAFALPLWALRGRAALKRRIAARVVLDPAALPYHAELLAWLRSERESGRRLALVSAADEGVVRAVSKHLGIFDEVIASDGARNLKGANKRDALAARFGAGKFDYAGNDASDLAVWEAARQAIIVGASPRLIRRAGAGVARTFPLAAPRWRAALRSLRAHQWVKNVLVFVPLLMAPEALELPLLGNAFLSFVAFSLCASSVYVVNDLLDLDADRRHPTKRRRPLASGELPLAAGLVLAPACLGAGLIVASRLPPAFVGVLLAYLAVTAAYSFRLKQEPILDVVVLALLYTGRVLAGAAATSLRPSPWILAFSLFFFFSMAFVKRCSELHGLRHAGALDATARGYSAADLEWIGSAGAASGYVSVLVAALYINSDRVSSVYARPELLWLVCPLLLYWISRIWLLAHRGRVDDDPVLFAVRDRTSWAVGGLLAATLVAARFA
jgi:4-hydroxybenzoate polyprenyltransferase/phosphoserine phosphatase